MSYKIIYDSIIRCKGRIITFIHDYKSEQFVDFIIEDLKSNYEIVRPFDLDTFNMKDNSVIVLDLLELSNYKLSQFVTLPDTDVRIKISHEIDYQIRNLLSKVWDKNIIVIILRNYKYTSNTNVFGREAYLSDTVFLLKDNKLSFLKKRTVDYQDDIFDIKKILRYKKLEKLNKL